MPPPVSALSPEALLATVALSGVIVGAVEWEKKSGARAAARNAVRDAPDSV